MKFQSCDGSSYCTALGQNGCTDIVPCQLRDSCGYQISARSEAISAETHCQLCHVYGPDIMSRRDGKCVASTFVNMWYNWWWISAGDCFLACTNLAVGCYCLLFNNDHVLQLWWETVAICRQMIHGLDDIWWPYHNWGWVWTKFSDICLMVEEKPQKKLNQETDPAEDWT